MSQTAIEVSDPARLKERVESGISALSKVVVGKSMEVRRVMAVLLSGGHILMEDLPGVGKTTLAKGMSRILGGTFQRVQGTNDLLPSDLLGVHLWDPRNQVFRFQPGPVFANVLLLDELNRISPKTQSAMLEVMVEGQVTLDRTTYPLPDPFFVMATQNPTDHSGTFPLPDSQMDRFACVLHLGSADQASERLILKDEAGAERLSTLEPVLELEEWKAARLLVKSIQVSQPVLDYLERVLAKIRKDGIFCSTRAATQWLALAKAQAWLEKRHYLIPDDLQATFGDTMAHRGTMDDKRLNRDDRRDHLSRTIQDVAVGWKS